MESSNTLLALCIVATLFTGAVSECNMDDVQCEFWLDIEYKLTMMHGKDAVYPYNGKLYKYDVPEAETNRTQPINNDHVIIADGWETPSLVIVANGTMPGPAIEVYEGQTVVVHVTNHLTSSGITIHWHGLHQRGTPWMDGTAFITQCPIEPGQTFTYRFQAAPKGTFWYHSHAGSQLGMGLFGAFIIHERKPMVMDEHIMVLQDWNHDWDQDTFHMRMKYGSFINRQKIPFTKSHDGAMFGHFIFQSGLINGRGRYFGETNTSNMAPLSEYQVEQGKDYRFRVIGASATYPFRVSIDGHSLKLVASDGFDLQPMDVESFIIQPGERFDFILHANQRIDNYWIRAESLEIGVTNHIALAILRYKGSSNQEPISKKLTCSPNNRCRVVNCPFSSYPADQHVDCVTFDVLRSKDKQQAPGGSRDTEDDIVDIFMNFGFPGPKHPAAINGIVFKPPPSPPLTQPHDVTTHCSPSDGCSDHSTCQCSHTVNLDHGKVYQIVMSAMGNGKWFSHPIHMHGHSFNVVKMGFPLYNKTTGAAIADNPDIDCHGNVANQDDSLCTQPSWSNSAWAGNSVPGLQLESSPLKDTIMVPTGGYVVVRIKADNPGVWFLHCHMELHILSGMALMLHEGFGQYPPPPKGFPRCGNFYYNV